MPINFIPNDPLSVGSMPLRKQKARPNRPPSRAGFNYLNPVKKQAVYAVGTPEFLFWQCREAALMALETWESINGKLLKWARATPDPKRLDFVQNAGNEPNAYYDGQSFSFFEYVTPNKTTYSGASTDIVAHEVGHGLLDTIRPDLWASKLTEPNAFHEAFGDCMAILTALSDEATRVALLAASPKLNTANFVEATGDDLGDGIARSDNPKLGPKHPAAGPRHALNDFKWQLPTTLPAWGPPDVLIGEEHSFGRIFSGCFYDLIRNIFAAVPHKSEAALWTAAQTAAKILIAGTEKAPETPRFFQSVGRAMALADQTMNGGANRQAIRDAFARHNIALGSAALMSPRATLAGSAPKMQARAAGGILTASTRSDIKRRIGADPASRLSVVPKTIGGEEVVEAVNYREVSLTGLSEHLKGVVAVAAEPVLVGSVGRRAAVVSDLPEPNTTVDEVRSYVESLLKHDMIEFGGTAAGGGSTKRAAGARRGAVASAAGPPSAFAFKTHAIRARAGKKVIERVRFMCRHGG